MITGNMTGITKALESGGKVASDAILVSTNGLFTDSRLMEGLMQGLTKALHDNEVAEHRQHKIAEKALHDPKTQQVREIHNGQAVETVVVEKKDGSVQTFKPDGTKIVETADGTKTTEYPKDVDATVAKVIEKSNGEKETINRDGSKVYESPELQGKKIKVDRDGTETEIRPNGTQIITRPDGTQTKITADGTKLTRKPDGEEILEKPNGDRIVTRPEMIEDDGTKVWTKDNGTEVREGKDGSRTTIYPESVNKNVESIKVSKNGDVEQHLRDGSVIKLDHKGGMEITNKDGSTSKFKANGDIEVHDAHGNGFKMHKGVMTVDSGDLSTTYHSKGVTEIRDHKTGDRTIKTSDGKEMVIHKDGTVEERGKKDEDLGGTLVKIANKAAERIMRGGF